MSTCRPSVRCKRHLPHCLRSNSCWRRQTRSRVPRADLVRTAQGFGCVPLPHSSQRVYNKYIIFGCSREKNSVSIQRVRFLLLQRGCICRPPHNPASACCLSQGTSITRPLLATQLSNMTDERAPCSRVKPQRTPSISRVFSPAVSITSNIKHIMRIIQILDSRGIVKPSPY